MESNLNIKKPDTPKLNVETVSSAVFGKDDGAGGGSGESIKNIHKTLSKLSGHIRNILQDKNDLTSLSKDLERLLLQEALKATKGRRIDAAKILGLGRNTITRKIKDLDL